MGEKICPIMAKGWLANEHALRSCVNSQDVTFALDNYPKCVTSDCEIWVSSQQKCGFRRDVK